MSYGQQAQQFSSREACAFIFARGGSKGVPDKNLRVVGGASLLERSVLMSLEIVGTDRTWVSTDSDAIAQQATSLGVGVIRRGNELSGDNSPEWLAWQHAISEVQLAGVNFDCFLSVPTTAPLREVDDVVRALKALDHETDCVVSITRAKNNPFFNMVSCEENGRVQLVNGGKPSISRQSAPEVYSMTTVAYVSRPEFILSHSGFWEGRVRGVEIPEERALDIDSEWDLHIADLLLSNGSVP